jgi:hypothetical protein
MTENERGDFDAVILSVSARISGADLEPHIKAWVDERLADKAADALRRVDSRIRKATLTP